MAAVITVVCPKCQKAIQAPDSIAGKKIKCKGCQNVFSAVAADAQAAVKPGDNPEEWGEIKAYGIEALKLKPRCPHCAWELEYEDDVVCLHCGYNLVTRQRMQQRVMEPLTGMDWVTWWAGPIFCLLLTLGMIGASVWLLFVWDLDWGEPWTMMTKVYCVAMAAAVGYFATKFALKRLIFHPRPPEHERKIDLDQLQEGEQKPIRRRPRDDDDEDEYADEDDDDEE